MSFLPTSSPGGTLSFPDILARQEELEAEAREAVPFTFTHCTYSLPSSSENYDRQPIYACLSCRPAAAAAESDSTRNGICAACSVACHGGCELVELFSRRDFVCDCGTTRIDAGKGKGKCTITLREGDTPNADNVYDDNYDGIFCECKIRYDPDTEEDEMIQCLVCEDWYHLTKCLASGLDSCSVSLPTRKRSRHASRSSGIEPSSNVPLGSEAEPDEGPPPPLDEDDFDHLVCEKCVLGQAKGTVGRYVGTPGFMVLWADGKLSATASSRQGILHNDLSGERGDSPEAVEVTTVRVAKRSRSVEETAPAPETTQDSGSFPVASVVAPSEQDEPSMKRAKLEIRKEDPKQDKPALACSAPPEHNELLASWELTQKDKRDPFRMHGFLQEGWRDRWCRCMKCEVLYVGKPYLLREEVVYSAPEDPDSQKSLYDLGQEALSKMPREQAVHGLEAYSGMRDSLKAYLEPFAREGKVVKQEDVLRFFAEQKEKLAGRV